MTDRIIAIGDIHGCANALATLLEAIKPTQQDTLVFLGDYIDRGPDSPAFWSRLSPWASAAPSYRLWATTRRCCWRPRKASPSWTSG